MLKNTLECIENPLCERISVPCPRSPVTHMVDTSRVFSVWLFALRLLMWSWRSLLRSSMRPFASEDRKCNLSKYGLFPYFAHRKSCR